MLPVLIATLLAGPPIAGVTLAPHYEGTRTRAQMESMVDQIAELGASHVVLVVQWGQKDVLSDTIAPYQWGTDDAEVRALARHAHARGLSVVVFPILRLAEIRPGEWRGTLAPRKPARWWAQYRRFILHYARLAAAVGADVFSVGSELGTMEAEYQRWSSLIAEVRPLFPGRLTYSANWDRFLHVPFWSEVDLVGVNAYHPITKDDDASVADLARAWRRLRDRLELWQYFMARPLVFTEVGYPSVDGGARRPYDFAADGPVDLEEQRRAYAAFVQTWSGRPALNGVFIWLWTGPGGADDPGYMLRGKPAAKIVVDWFSGWTGQTSGRRP